MGGMGKRAGAGPRSMGRRRILRVLTTVRVVLVVAAMLLALDGLCALAIRVFGPQDGPLLFFLLGLLFGGVLGAVWYVAAVVSGGANALIGAGAETWTAKELVGLGPEWEVIHNVTFDVGHRGAVVDVDHVAVGPGGVLVVETKWSSSLLELDAARRTWKIQSAARQAEDNAGRVRALLSRDVPDVQVRPLVVLWGAVRPARDAIVKLDAVSVVSGDDSSRWRSALVSELGRVTPRPQAAALSKIRDYGTRARERVRS